MMLTTILACATGTPSGGGNLPASPPPASVEPIDLALEEPLWSAPEGTWTMAALGDMSGDGLVDVYIETGPTATANIVAGPLDRALTIATDRIAWAEGYGPGSAGDVTGDGVPDLYLLEKGANEGFRFLAGPVGGDLGAATPVGELDGVMNPMFGDATFDGISDMILSTGNTIEVVAGPWSRFATEAPAFSIRMTWQPEDGDMCEGIDEDMPGSPWLETVGDVNHDEVEDRVLFLSALPPCPQMRALMLEPGLSGEIVADATSTGDLVRAYDLAAVGDQDGDGIGDVWFTTTAGVDQVFAGPATVEGGALVTGVLIGELPSDGLEAIGDADGDGLTDWLETSERYEGNQQITEYKVKRGGGTLALDEALQWWSHPGPDTHLVVGDLLLVSGPTGVHVLPMMVAE